VGLAATKSMEQRAMYMQMMVLAKMGGLTDKSIGQAVGVSEASVSRALTSLEGKRMIADMCDMRAKEFHVRAMDRIQQVQGQQVENLIDIANNSDNDRVRLSAITDILDRAGTKVQEEKVMGDAPFIQVNIANIESKHTEGLMPTTLVKGIESFDAEFEEVMENGSEDRDRFSSVQQAFNWPEPEQELGGGAEDDLERGLGGWDGDRKEGDEQEISIDAGASDFLVALAGRIEDE
jgi:predicted transcriptional regulator